MNDVVADDVDILHIKRITKRLAPTALQEIDKPVKEACYIERGRS
jgi:hypothetical protein